MARMSQLRLDPLTGRWAVVSLDRAERPRAFLPRTLRVQADSERPCPFCPGHEEATPPALETYGPNKEWLIRVVPNLYPAFDGTRAIVVSHLGPVFTQAQASGIHEVLVYSRDHDAARSDLPVLERHALRDAGRPEVARRPPARRPSVRRGISGAGPAHSPRPAPATSGRRRLQPGDPLGAVPDLGRLPLAHPRAPQADDDGR